LTKRTVAATPLEPVVDAQRIRQQQRTPLLPSDLGTENARLIRANRAMARYVHPRLAEELMNGGKTAPRVRSTLATILFADIRGYCELLERVGSLETVRLLDQFFTLVVDCVDRHGGTVDKFIGDAMMATFGIPAAAEDDADRAVEAACAILRDIENWNAGRAAGELEIHVGIGIDTDIVVAGTIGAPSRMDYTVIGDGVNTAARLQQASKTQGVPLLISARTRARLVREHYLRPVDMICVGRGSRTVAAYDVLGWSPDGKWRGMSAVSSDAAA
jgi:adenylate cyclase